MRCFNTRHPLVREAVSYCKRIRRCENISQRHLRRGTPTLSPASGKICDHQATYPEGKMKSKEASRGIGTITIPRSVPNSSAAAKPRLLNRRLWPHTPGAACPERSRRSEIEPDHFMYWHNSHLYPPSARAAASSRAVSSNLPRRSKKF